MAYHLVKIIHIVSVACLLTMMLSIIRRWWKNTDNAECIQLQIGFGIAPLALATLFTGFMVISIKHSAMTTPVIMISMIGFIALLLGWCVFAYLLTSASKRIQAYLLGWIGLVMVCMLFFMVNSTLI
jgi:hypothetical protein